MLARVFNENLTKRLLDSEYGRDALTFCVTAARFPAFAPNDTRLRSLSAAPQLDDASRNCWSDAGFFLHNEASAVCFHCGCRVVLGSADSVADLLRLHERCSPACELLRLLRVAHGLLSERNQQVLESAARLRRALTKLRSDLQQCSSMINLIESFGFTRSSIMFCACRVFMTRGGCLPDRPGDLVQEIHECEKLLPDCGHVIDVEGALIESRRSEGRGSAEQETRSSAEQERQQSSAEQERRSSAEQERRSSAEQERRSSAEQERQQSSTELQQRSSGPHNATSIVTSKQKPPDADKKPRCAAGLTHQISVEEESEGGEDAASRDSDKCTQCRVRVRDHVTLPCAHFLLCHSCLGTNCPKCGKQILAAIRAFIA